MKENKETELVKAILAFQEENKSDLQADLQASIKAMKIELAELKASLPRDEEIRKALAKNKKVKKPQRRLVEEILKHQQTIENTRQ